MSSLKIATWNVNSIRARIERLLPWLEQRDPDIVCLQETKVEDEAFPAEEIGNAGYRVSYFGQKTYNGVAILSKGEIETVARNFEDGEEDSHARFLDVKTAGMRVLNVYVPNGKSVDDPAFQYKLRWLERLRSYLENTCDPDERVYLGGDFNVAPQPLDVYDPELWEGKVHFHPEERQAIARLEEWGLRDAVRICHPETQVFSWWDYRQLAFPKNRGLRIDLAFLSLPLMERCREAFVDREARKGKKPSDHAPVFVVLETGTGTGEERS